MRKGAKEFQKATADRIEKIFRSGKQKRVLLADEVGLGKTIVAREVIDRVRHIRMDANDDMYRVVYVCSNINIVQQNTSNLGMKDKLDISESRLSMQHLLIQEKVAELKKQGKYREDGRYADGEMPELLIPLTPGTSFSMSSGCGNMNERALMYNMVIRMPEFQGWESFLLPFFMYYGDIKKKNWKDYVEFYSKRVDNCDSGYIDKIYRRLQSNTLFKTILPRLMTAMKSGNYDWNEKRFILSHLRMVFAQVSIEELEPDFVIMDEFQRFSSLIDSSNNDDTEQGMLTKKFFGEMSGENAPLILLLSATPYKPYTTLEELNETNSDQQYEDFLKLTNFLFTGEKAKIFKKVWERYSLNLSQLNSDNFDILLASKNEAENDMYGAMCRTERISNSIIDTTTHVKNVAVTEGDLLSYCQMQALLRYCKKNDPKFKWGQVPMDYVKSSPYLLSFMDKYIFKTDIMKALDVKNEGSVCLPFSERSQQLILKFHGIIYNYGELPANNARLEALKNVVFNLKKKSYCLLWIPASHPYYDTPDSNVFKLNHDFSKVLVFSSWEMVPRMIAFMLSYEEERLTIGQGVGGATYTNQTGGQRLRDVNDKGDKDVKSKSLFEYVSPYLTGLYIPKESYGKNIDEIRASIENKIRRKITGNAGFSIVPTGRCRSTYLFKLVKWLDGQQNIELDTKIIPERAIRTLANMAIGSPAICLYRRVGDAVFDVKQKNKNGIESTLISQFTSLFNLRQSAGIMDILYKDGDGAYFEDVFDYCVMGNMQAVIDEYIHMIDETGSDVHGIVDTIYNSFVGVSSIEYTTYGKEVKHRLRTHYSLAYTNKKVDEKNVSHAINVRQAFNSPFHPFVLTTTSIGQEGLDFHWYCRKIMHWNIPSNPQDIEQREGRINRYKCLAIRRNLASRYSGLFSWDDIFEKAEEELKGNDGGLVPYWCLPVEKFKHPEMIERIVLMYPLSSDVERYRRMADVLALYRLTMGQPRQEELLRLFAGLTEEQVSDLLFNLSPIRHKKQA